MSAKYIVLSNTLFRRAIYFEKRSSKREKGGKSGEGNLYPSIHTVILGSFLTWSPNLYSWKCNLYYPRTQLLIQESQKTPACRYTISKQRTMFTVSERYYLLRIFTFTFWTICVYSFLPVYWAVDKQTHEVDNNTCGGKNTDHKLCQNFEIYNYLDFLLFVCDLKSTSVYILESEMVFDLNKNGANWITFGH